MSDEIKVQAKNKKTKLIITIAAVVIAILTIVAIVLASANSATAKQVKEQLSLGDKYLSELNYEQAIAAYELAIEIDPKSADAYLGLAEVYEEMGEYDKAIEVLEEAKAGVGDEEAFGRIEEKLKAIEEKKQAPPDLYFKGLTMENDYLKVIQDEATGKIAITLRGLKVQDAYTVNRSTSEKGYLEYSWSVELQADKYTYEVSTTSWTYDPGKENERPLSDMQHSIWKHDMEEMSVKVIGNVEMYHTPESITWIITMPEGHTLDLAEVNKYRVEVYDCGEYIIKQDYVP